MQCEMCGSTKEPRDLVYIKIEGSLLKVCELCSHHGTFVRKVSELMQQPTSHTKKIIAKAQVPEIEESIVQDYNERIHRAREKKGLTMKELAHAINEKESLMHKLETKTIDLNLALARKLERFFSIHLVENVEISKIYPSPLTSSSNLTLGDIVTIKRRGKKPED